MAEHSNERRRGLRVTRPDGSEYTVTLEEAAGRVFTGRVPLAQVGQYKFRRLEPCPEWPDCNDDEGPCYACVQYAAWLEGGTMTTEQEKTDASRLDAIRRYIADTEHTFSHEGIEGCLLCGSDSSATPCPIASLGRSDADLLLELVDAAQTMVAEWSHPILATPLELRFLQTLDRLTVKDRSEAETC